MLTVDARAFDRAAEALRSVLATATDQTGIRVATTVGPADGRRVRAAVLGALVGLAETQVRPSDEIAIPAFPVSREVPA